MSKKNSKFTFSDREIEIINGCLLGDGSLTKEPCTSSLFRYSSSEREHTAFVLKFFSQADLVTESWNNGPKLSQYYNKENGNTYNSYYFNTRSVFYTLRQKWYIEGKKIVPRDLVLTPLTCLLWYIGDGTLSKGEYIVLATCCFNNNDINFLIKLLNELKLEAYKSKTRKYTTITIPRRNVGQFLDYIGSCPIECYKYKWEYKGQVDWKKKILQLDLNNNLIKQWESGNKVEKVLGYDQGPISKCCYGKYKTAYGYKWEFAETNI